MEIKTHADDVELVDYIKRWDRSDDEKVLSRALYQRLQVKERQPKHAKTKNSTNISRQQALRRWNKKTNQANETKPKPNSENRSKLLREENEMDTSINK